MNSDGEDTKSIVKRMKNIRFYGEHASACGLGGSKHIEKPYENKWFWIH